jgi:WhiB family redox-sensing transcriptional regulator
MAMVGATARIGTHVDGAGRDREDPGAAAVGGLLDAVDAEFGTRAPGIPVPLARTRDVAPDDLLGAPAGDPTVGSGPGDDLGDDDLGDDLDEDEDLDEDDPDGGPASDATDVGALLLLAARSRDLDPLWKDRALCAETDPEAFFPEKGGSTREAKRVCSVCEVRAECLDSALANDERFGIWGGLSERERRRLKKRVG